MSPELLILMSVLVVAVGRVAREHIRARTVRHGHITTAVRDVACRWLDNHDGGGRSQRRR